MRPSAKPARILRGSGVKPSALRPQLRRIAIKFCRDIFAGGGGHVRGNPKTARIDCACCYASRIGRWRRRASQYCGRGCLSYCTEFSRAAGEPLYYRLDWATQHKCWYLRAPGQPAQQAAAPATLARVISVQSKSAQAISATTDKPVLRIAQEGNTAPSMIEEPVPQASTSSQTGAQGTEQAPGRSRPARRGCGPMLRPRTQCPTMQRGLPGAASQPTTTGYR